ncbi:MAG: long-chain-fatty-acid--CoA ligase [Candidatus Aminicenantes bacterium]|nr:MAG: long-chain-fatty-acid--CoA ligase [Candidatus Aminicenantes bacterium]
MSLSDVLKKTASDSPDQEAVICAGKKFRYDELKDRVERLSSSLLSLGIRKNDRVAIIHRNCHRYLETYFAAAKIGAVLVPINYRLSGEDFVFILNDSQAKWMIAQPDLVSCLRERKHDLLMLRGIVLTDPSAAENWPDCLLYESLIEETALAEEPSVRIDDSDMAQIYYTSGTTGRPKGVILTHRNHAAHTDGTIRELKLTQDDRWLHVSPMFHLADAWAVWALTKVGAIHVMVPGFEEKSVLETIEKHQITLSNFIPTMLNLLVNFPGASNYDFSSLRLIMSGGAPIAKEVVKKILGVFGCDYIQTYGLTETSPFLTMSILKEGMKSLPFEEKLQVMVTTGRPFETVQLKVVKQNGEEVHPDGGDVGEIIAKGESITPGYWGLPEETTERIVNGWLHTRDLAVQNPEGYVTIVDRMDDVIITGGENVFSVEVEDVLYAYPSVLEAAVIGLPNPVWGEKVIAVIVKKEGESCDAHDIIRFCKERLAPFKVPKEVIFSDQLPKTGSAKICKYKLRQIYGSKTRKNG